MNFGLYPGATPGSSNITEGYPLIGQSVEMGFTSVNFTTDNKEYLRAGYVKPYEYKYSQFFKRSPYACSILYSTTNMLSITANLSAAAFTYIATQSGYHYILPLESSDSGNDGISYRYTGSLASGFTNGAVESATELTRASVATTWGSDYLVIASNINSSSIGIRFVQASTQAVASNQNITANHLASNGATAGTATLLLNTTTNTTFTVGSTTTIKKYSATATSAPSASSHTAVTVASTPSSATMRIYQDAFAYLPSISSYISIGTVASGSYFVPTIWKTADLGSNWTQLYAATGYPQTSSQLNIFRARDHVATNGTSAVIVLPGTDLSTQIIWTDGTNCTLVDISNCIPFTYGMQHSRVSFDSSTGLYILSFSANNARYGNFFATSPDGKTWTPKFNILGPSPTLRPYNLAMLTARGNTLALYTNSASSNVLAGVVNVTGIVSKSIPTYINTNSLANGNNLSTYYRIA